MVVYCAGRAFPDDLVHFAHGAWAAAPQHGKNFQFGVGRTLQIRHTKTLLRRSSHVNAQLRLLHPRTLQRSPDPLQQFSGGNVIQGQHGYPGIHRVQPQV